MKETAKRKPVVEARRVLYPRAKRLLPCVSCLKGGARCTMLLLTLTLLLPSLADARTVQKLTPDEQRRYNMFYLESVRQKEAGRATAQFDLLRHALVISPDAPEALFDLALVAATHETLPDKQIEALFRRAVTLSPDNTYYEWSFAQYEMQRNRLDEAIALLQKLTADESKRVDAYSSLVGIYEQQGHYDKVLATLEEWEKMEGSDQDLSVMKVKALTKLQRYDDALHVIDGLCHDYPDEDYFPVLKAETNLDKGDSAAAMKAYREAVAVNPSSVTAQLFLVHYYQTSNDNNKMLDIIKQVILNERQDMNLRVSMMQSLISSVSGTADQPQILSTFRELLKQPMEDKSLMTLYATYLAQQKAPDSSYTPVVKKILEIDPTDEQARLQMLQNELHDKDYDGVVKVCREGIRYTPQQLLFYHLGGGALYQQKKTEEARALFEQGRPYVKQTKDKQIVSDYYASFGDVLHECGRKAEAYASYDSSLVFNPSNVVCLNNYAYFLSLDNVRMDEAEKMSAIVMKLEPDNPTYIDTYAWILFMQQNYKKAKVYMDRALKQATDAPEDASLYEHAGDIDAKLGDLPGAMKAWKKALKMGSDSKTLEKKIKNSKYYAE